MLYISLVVAAAFVGIDQLTKFLAVEYLKPLDTVSLIKFGETEVLNLTYCENDGAAFSILGGKQIFLIILTSVAILAALYLLFAKRVKNKGYIWSIAFLVSGGIGNLIDRVLNGFVVDFIDFRLINFAVFNVADICAVCGCISLVIFFIIDEVKSSKAKKLTSVNSAEPNESETKDSNDGQN